MFVQTSDPKMRACRVVSLRSSCVTRLLSDPRHLAGSLEAKVTMPYDDKERLQKLLQSFQHQNCSALFTNWDTSEVGTSKS